MLHGKRLKIWLGLVGVIVLALITFAIDWPGAQAGWKGLPSFPGKSWFEKQTYHLGLDLQGGTHLVYRADVSKLSGSDVDDAVAAARDVIERRVNLFGVAEPRVELDTVGIDKRINVELAGVSDINQAIKMIGETPQLDFREANENTALPADLTAAEKKKIADSEREALGKAQDTIRRLKGGADFETLAKELSQDPGSKDSGGDLGFFGKGVMVEPFEKAAFALKIDEITASPIKSDFGYHIILKLEERKAPDGSQEIRARHILFKAISSRDLRPPQEEWKVTALTGKYLKRAQVAFDPQTNEPQVTLEFNADGAKLFEEITARNVGKPVAIFLDGSPISAPVVQQKITGGEAVITGNFSLDEAQALSRRLTAGALPVPIELIVQQNVGPSLGKVSVAASLRAGIIGLLLVALFMILYYRLPGVLAVGALGIYVLLVLALFKVIPVTLTLAGLAGFIMSIGMAVDANVLIFERMKEELRLGKPLDLAIAEGFKRAWSSIRDGHVTTLITCAILFLLGTSSVKGFGLTLAIGVLASLFSAISVTRTFIRLIATPRMERVRVLFGAK